MKIAVDAMGGDHGPAPVIEGAMQAAQELGVGIILVGKQDELAAACQKLNCTDTRITIHHAPQVVEMHESPATVARKKRDSSIWVAKKSNIKRKMKRYLANFIVRKVLIVKGRWTVDG